MLNNITTIKTAITNTIQFIQIESKQIKAQTVLCFFFNKRFKEKFKKNNKK